MTDNPYTGADDSQARQRSRVTSDMHRYELSALAERITVVETRQRIHERQMAKEMSEMERRFSDDLSKVEKTLVETNKTLQQINIQLAEIKVKSGLIGILSAGVTVFLIMAWEWLKAKAKQ